VRTFSEPFSNVAQLAFPLVSALAEKARAVTEVSTTFGIVFARIGIAKVDLFAAGEACVAIRAKALIPCWRIIVATARSAIHTRIGRAATQASGAGRARPAISTSACIRLSIAGVGACAAILARIGITRSGHSLAACRALVATFTITHKRVAACVVIAVSVVVAVVVAVPVVIAIV
jgi:hypothetical protein